MTATGDLAADSLLRLAARVMRRVIADPHERPRHADDVAVPGLARGAARPRVRMSDTEARVYGDAVRLARMAWPRWVVIYGLWSRHTYAVAAFLPFPYVLDGPDPRALGVAMRAAERRWLMGREAWRGSGSRSGDAA